MSYLPKQININCTDNKNIRFKSERTPRELWEAQMECMEEDVHNLIIENTLECMDCPAHSICENIKQFSTCTATIIYYIATKAEELYR